MSASMTPYPILFHKAGNLALWIAGSFEKNVGAKQFAQNTPSDEFVKNTKLMLITDSVFNNSALRPLRFVYTKISFTGGHYDA